MFRSLFSLLLCYFFLSSFLPFVHLQKCYLVNRSSKAVADTFSYKDIIPLTLKNSNGNPDFTIACIDTIVSYDGDRRLGCLKSQTVISSTGPKRLYPIGCEIVSSDCFGDCWFPEEKANAKLIVDPSRVFTVTVQHACDCSMVGCDQFVNLVSSSNSPLTFPTGNTNLESCHVSSISVIIDNSIYSFSSIPSLESGEHNWQIKYSMNRFGKDNAWHFSSPVKKLCVLPESLPKVFISGSSLFPISSLDSNPTEYLATSLFSFSTSLPDSNCSSFELKTNARLICVYVSDHSRTCSYTQTVYLGTASVTSTYEHLIHFVSFGVGFAQKTCSSVTCTYTVPVKTHTGPLNREIKETFTVSFGCSFETNNVEFDSDSGSRVVHFSCPSSITPEITLILKSSFFSPIESKTFKISSVPVVSELDISVNESQIVVVSWFSVGGDSACSFFLSFVISGSPVREKTISNYKPTSIELTSNVFGKIVNGDVVSVKVVPKCGDEEGKFVSKETTVCIPTRPDFTGFSCPSCFEENETQFISSELSFEITFTLLSPCVVCSQTRSNYVFFEFGGMISTLPFQDNQSTYSFTHRFSFSGDYSLQSSAPDVPQSFRLNGFDVPSSSFRPLSFCIVPSLPSKPTIQNNVRSYLKLSQDPVTFEIKFSGIKELYSPCFSGGRYLLEYWTYTDRNPQVCENEMKALKDYSGETLVFSVEITTSQVYYYRIVGLTATDERYESETAILNVCSSFNEIDSPTLIFPLSTDVVSVLEPTFEWKLSSETISIRCGPGETAFLRLDISLTEVYESMLNKDEEFEISVSVSLFTSKFQLYSDYLLSLSTQYSWRLVVIYQESMTSTPIMKSSEVFSFKTVSRHCSYLDCHQGICDDLSVTCVCHSGYRGEFCDLSGLPVGAYVGIIVGILVIVSIFVIVAVILLKRHYFVGLRIPDMRRFMFFLPKPIHDDGDESKSLEEIEICVSNDLSNDFSWITNLLSCTPPTEADSLCRSVMYVFENEKKGLELLLHLISVEVSQSTSTATLFRNNSIATKCFRVYGRMYGLPYLFRIVFPLLVKLYKEEQKEMISVKGMSDLNEKTSNKSYELSFVGEETNDSYAALIEENSLLLQIVCEMFFKELKRNNSHFPVQFHLICQHIASEVEKKYPSHPIELCLAPFLFLRFFVAGITVPETFGIVDETPPQHLRRRLILISKLLSNMSTQVKFGEKEDYMVVMNDYLESKKSEFSEFYRYVLSPSPQQALEQEFVKVPEKYRVAGLEVLSYAIVKVENGEWEEELEIEDELNW